MNPDQLYHTSLAFHQNGQLDQAESGYRQLMTSPAINKLQQADVMHLLGVLCHQTGRNLEAIRLIDAALAIDAENPDYLNNLGLALRAAGQYERAIDSYQRALRINPRDIDLKTNLGNVFQELQRYRQAADCYRQVLSATPGDIDVQQALGYALQQLGSQYQQAGSYQDARHCYLEAIRCHISQHRADQNKQDAHHNQHPPGNSPSSPSQNMASNFELAALYYNLGNAQRELSLADDAAASYRIALQLSPQDADIHNNLGNVLREQGDLQQAMLCYQTAIRLNPQLYHAQVHLTHQKQHSCDWANSVMKEPHGLEEFSRLEEHGGLSDQGQLANKAQESLGAGSMTMEIAKIRQWVTQKPQAQISPFAFLAMPGTSAHEQRLCADRWLENRYQRQFEQVRQQESSLQAGKLKTHGTDPQDDHASATDQRIHIGYLSADFRMHPLASLISELIELHDSRHFRLSAYSYGPNDNSTERKRLEAAFDQFVDIRALSQQDAANRIQTDSVDILVDLTGFTQGSRTGIAALRPATLNVSWLGFPGTMGAFTTSDSSRNGAGFKTGFKNESTGSGATDNGETDSGELDLNHQMQPGIQETALFDYLISDATITPLSHVADYAEKLALMPDCYQPNDRKRNIGEPPSRLSCQLPPEAFVYCCFNQSFKITPTIFKLWMRLLHAVPGSVLWLLESNALARENLLNAARALDINPARLIFAPRVPLPQHLARHTCADLFLDTLPYNAHTTASDALWMGLPVITCLGETFAGRVAASLLHAAHLPELVTSSLQEYEQLAIALATQPARLQALKTRLSASRAHLPLFDTPRFASNLAALYQHIWQRRQQGLAPAAFQLKPSDIL